MRMESFDKKGVTVKEVKGTKKKILTEWERFEEEYNRTEWLKSFSKLQEETFGNK